MTIEPHGKYIILQIDMENYSKIDAKFYGHVLQPLLASNGLSFIDVLILNAGISSRGSFEDTNMECIHKLMVLYFVIKIKVFILSVHRQLIF